MVEKPRDRITPHPSKLEVWRPIALVFLAAVAFVAGILFLMDASMGIIRLFGLAGVFLGGWWFYKYSRPLVHLITTTTKRNRFGEASATAQAIIRNQRIIEHRTSSNLTYTYEILAEFDAEGMDGLTKAVLLRTLVTKELYSALSGTSTVTVRYSKEDPRIAVLEGEKHFAPNGS